MIPNVMIDLETMSTEPTASILSIGAVKFDIEEEKITGTFYQNVELSSCLQLGMHRMQSTLDWWTQDNHKEARDALTKEAVPIWEACNRFVAWSGDDIIPWSNGATFDIPILKHALHLCRLKEPWHFRNESCFRTLKRLFPTVLVASVGMKHNALDDATYQATRLMRILKCLKLAEDMA